MYNETLHAVGETAGKKVACLASNPVEYFISSVLAGAYVGVGVFLAFIVGSSFADSQSPWLRIAMGGSFAVALSLVIFAGGELFTGNNMSMVVGYRLRKASLSSLAGIWTVSWLGNLIGAVILAVLLYYSSTLNGKPEILLVQEVAEKKMHLSVVEMICRGALCNWLVCLAVWCTHRMKSESGKLIMIFWCLYAFVASGFEHSVANMTLLSLALLQPHAPALSVDGMAYNLLWVTIGNIIGGSVFVGAAYLSGNRPA
ncbi:MAG: formate/nitrite transporter family protein [Armatimonadota bacterium]|nr:formate/nitrite transporter family protein [bacterium]